MAQTTHLTTQNWENKPPFAPANPKFQGPQKSASIGMGEFVDYDGSWCPAADGKGLVCLSPDADVQEPFVGHLDIVTNGAVIRDQMTELVFIVPNDSSQQLFVVARGDSANKNYYAGFLRPDLAAISVFLGDAYNTTLTSQAVIFTPGVKYRAQFYATGASPTTLRLVCSPADDPTTIICDLQTTSSTSGLQIALTGGFLTRGAARFTGGYVCEVSRFTLGTDRTAGMPAVISYSDDGATLKLIARRPENFTGTATHQWQFNTAGDNAAWSNVTGGTGATTLVRTQPLAANTDYYFKIVSTDSTGGGGNSSYILGPLRQRPNQYHLLIGDSRADKTSELVSIPTWSSEKFQAYQMNMMQSAYTVKFPAKVAHSGAETTHYLTTGTYHDEVHAAILTYGVKTVHVQLGPNDARLSARTKAAYKTNMLAIIAWLIADGIARIWLHGTVWYYELFDSMDLNRSYAAALDEIVAADTSGIVKRGAGLPSSLNGALAFPDGYDTAHLHLYGRAYEMEAMGRSNAVVNPPATAASSWTAIGGTIG